MRRFHRLLSLVLFLGLSSPALAAAADGPEPRVLAAEGYDEFQRGNYPEALALFERAHKIEPSPRLLRAIAKCLFELRRYSESVVACEAALAAQSDALGEGLRADVQELRARALGFTGTAAIAVAPASAEVTVDGRPLPPRGPDGRIRLDVGRHLVEATAPGRLPVRRELAIDSSASAELRLVLPEAYTPADAPPSRTGSYALVGAGSLVGAAGHHLRALVRRSIARGGHVQRGRRTRRELRQRLWGRHRA